MKTVVIIPARLASTRFPGKLLVDIRGKTMIQRTYEQALKVPDLDYVTVATADEQIVQNIKSFGGRVLTTSGKHLTGTDCCLEAAEKLQEEFNLADQDVVINVQGDEPYIHPESIALIKGRFKEQAEAEIVTLYKSITSESDLFSNGTAKVILNKQGEIIYFSRVPIPYLRDVDQKSWLASGMHHKQVGIYGYRFGVLKKIARLEQSPLEIAEKLEQLRWIENGYVITGQETPHESFSVDTPEDLKKVDLFVEKE
ncbi:MAG: 3-deoxy-manno-octulosonate cytidylyltransferase [bacterium]|nr:3-deoxy-manno-octulosonate cytidylyltransferase [bacterium]